MIDNSDIAPQLHASVAVHKVPDISSLVGDSSSIQSSNHASPVEPEWAQAHDGSMDIKDKSSIAEPHLSTENPELYYGSRSKASVATSASPPSPSKKGCGEAYNLHKFTLYETASWYYIVGSEVTERQYRVLKIDRTAEVGNLSLTDDKTVYTQKEIIQLLDTIDDGNRGTGGVKLRCTMWGLLGFIKFTGPYYMLLITRKSTVAMLGGHYVYQVDGTELIPLTPVRAKPDVRNVEESRFLSIHNNLDLTRSFYYSYSYDITRTLQMNITREREALANGRCADALGDPNTMFVWNSHLLQPAMDGLNNPFHWCRPVVHGYIDQSTISVYGREAFITIIARRSRFFAGARFLKRGANDLGYVANDVETEQIVSDSLTTSFHSSGPRLFSSPQYTAYVQHRGSIPLYWTQDNTGVTPKPPIELNLIDPFYGAAALHFDDLFKRYGTPIYVLNLVKARERTPRESKLLNEFTTAVNYLNQFLPEEHKILYHAWDMSRAAKSRDQDVIQTLEAIAESVVTLTGLFHNGDGKTSPVKLQNGVARTNCIDCLDRTNAAQFVIGKRALGHQLHTLGILGDTSIDYDTDAVNLFTHMYHDHGDTIAIQYGGSQLVNTMETYRKINQWTSHSRDMIESFRRYYNNSFLDGQRQEAYNLFLGNYIFTLGQPMLWDLATDYYLHHADPRTWSKKRKRDYIHWFTSENLSRRKSPRPVSIPYRRKALIPSSCTNDDYWMEYYRPSTLSSFPKMFVYKMNSTVKYIPFNLKSVEEDMWDRLSPFLVRADSELDSQDKWKSKKGVTIVEPCDSQDTLSRPSTSGASLVMTAKGAGTKGISLQRWLQPVPEKTIIKLGTTSQGQTLKINSSDPEKSKASHWTFAKAVHDTLNPCVNRQEADDYAQYIAHPQNLPLVVTTETPEDYDTDYQEYVSRSWKLDSLVPARDDEDVSSYSDLLKIGDNPLAVTDEDTQKKRYKAYRKWLSGKPLFKQLPVDLDQIYPGLANGDSFE